MKKYSKCLVVLTMLFLTAPVFGQFNNFSFGIVGTHFSNINNDSRVSETKNPLSYGVILGYKLDDHLSVAFTGEYFKDDMENFAGQEKNFRAHLSAYVMPFEMKTVIPYFSAGFVYTNRKFEYANSTESTKNFFNGKFGVGVDYPVFRNISLNADLGLYTDGLKVTGWSKSFGLRYCL